MSNPFQKKPLSINEITANQSDSINDTKFVITLFI